MRAITALFFMISTAAVAQSVTLVLEGGLPRVTITVNDRVTVPAVIDTAVNSALALCETHAKMSGLTPGETVEIYTASHVVTAHRTRIHTLA